MVLPVLVVVVLVVALLISYPWQVLTIGVLLYLGFLPAGFLSYREYQRKDAAAAAATAMPAGDGGFTASPPAAPGEDAPDRTSRLN